MWRLRAVSARQSKLANLKVGLHPVHSVAEKGSSLNIEEKAR